MEYNFREIKSGDIPEIVELEKHLWGNDYKQNLQHFKWKHVNTPFSETLLGAVATFKNKIVAYRGCVKTVWQLKRKKYDILSFSDVVVHPLHRRKGLFSSLTNYILEIYQNRSFHLSLNLSSNDKSQPGYIKLGWKLFYNPEKLVCHTFTGLVRYGLAKKGYSIKSKKTFLGLFDNIEISAKFYHKALSDLINQIAKPFRKFYLIKDETFFKWRFLSPRRNYLVCYYWDKDVIIGYIILNFSEVVRTAEIIDYGEKDGSGSLLRLVQFIKRISLFTIVTIPNYNIDNTLVDILSKNSFKPHSFLVRQNVPPILIRPVRNTFTEKDWFIDGIDSRNIENWDITAICSDAI